MSDKKTYAAIAFLAVLAVTFTVSSATSLLMSSAVLTNNGQVSTQAYARSGSASDIQAAVDWVATHGGAGNVYVPAGTFNFVEVGEAWKTVIIPTGINIIGAPNNRDSNGQNLEWRTVLIMPYEAPSYSAWFTYDINLSRTENTFRFSDIKLVSWRYFNQSSTAMYYGLTVNVGAFQDYPTAGLKDFRIDHCAFQDCTENAINFYLGWTGMYVRRIVSGVIDHNVLNNTYGIVTSDIDGCTVRYGIGMRRWASDVWEPNAANVFGKYNNYTIVIEDNYFSKWRHCTSSNDGIHQIIRNNIVEGGYGFGEFDGHGSYAVDSRPYAVGTRAMEIYNNTFRNPDKTWWTSPWAINVRGGSALIYNNTLQGYYSLAQLQNDGGNYAPYRPDNFVSQTYVWNNNLNGAFAVSNANDNVLNVNYFLRAPNLPQDGFAYTPYQYPHPLTMQG